MDSKSIRNSCFQTVFTPKPFKHLLMWQWRCVQVHPLVQVCSLKPPLWFVLVFAQQNYFLPLRDLSICPWDQKLQLPSLPLSSTWTARLRLPDHVSATAKKKKKKNNPDNKLLEWSVYEALEQRGNAFQHGSIRTSRPAVHVQPCNPQEAVSTYFCFILH